MVLKKQKKPNISKLKKELLSLVKQQVRIRDNYTCQWCGKNVKGSDCHVSHVIPVSHGNVLAFDPLNMKVLCYHCHLNVWHKNPLKATEWFTARFPDRAKYLNEMKHVIVKWKEFDYQRMIDTIKKNI